MKTTRWHLWQYAVKLVALIGVLVAQRLHLFAAEHLLGLVVAGFALHLTWETFKPRLDASSKRDTVPLVERETKAPRVAYACRKEGTRLIIINHRRDATHLLIGNMPQDGSPGSDFHLERVTTDVMSFAHEKKVEILFLHRPTSALPVNGHDIQFKNALSSDPETELGIPLPGS